MACSTSRMAANEWAAGTRPRGHRRRLCRLPPHRGRTGHLRSVHSPHRLAVRNQHRDCGSDRHRAFPRRMPGHRRPRIDQIPFGGWPPPHVQRAGLQRGVGGRGDRAHLAAPAPGGVVSRMWSRWARHPRQPLFRHAIRASQPGDVELRQRGLRSRLVSGPRAGRHHRRLRAGPCRCRRCRAAERRRLYTDHAVNAAHSRCSAPRHRPDDCGRSAN